MPLFSVGFKTAVKNCKETNDFKTPVDKTYTIKSTGTKKTRKRNQDHIYLKRIAKWSETKKTLLMDLFIFEFFYKYTYTYLFFHPFNFSCL